MRERDISEAEVSQVLSQPDSLGGGRGNALVARRRLQERRLTVVYESVSQDIKVIITVYREE